MTCRSARNTPRSSRPDLPPAGDAAAPTRAAPHDAAGERLSRIDGLRGLAILGVIAVHTGIAFPSPWRLTSFGKHGVELFFLVSGFILCHVAARERFSTPAFLVKRFFRLAPLYYLVLLACYLVGFNEPLEVQVTRQPLDTANALWHASFLHGLHPDYVRSVYAVAWSLTPEVVFYLLFPLLWLLSRRWLLPAFAGAVALALVTPRLGGALYGYTPAMSIWARHSPPFSLYLFLFGMLVFQNPGFFHARAWRVIGPTAAGLFLLGGAGVTLPALDGRLDAVTPQRFHLFVLLTFPWLVYCDWSALRRVLESRVLAFMGRVSYSAFLVHIAVVYGLAWCWPAALPRSYLLGLGAIVVLTFALAAATFAFVEQPGNRLGRAILRAWRTGRAAERLGIALAPGRRIAARAMRWLAGKVAGVGRRIDDDPQRRRVEAWWRLSPGEKLRHEYELGPDSIVLDVGGYKGQWAAEIAACYGCTVHVFEPVPQFVQVLRERFAGNPRIFVHDYGLAGEDAACRIALCADSSSVHRDSGQTCEIRLRQAKAVLDDLALSRIDLTAINIEGGEYALLEHLLDTGMVERFDNLQVQFHDCVHDAERRMRDIQRRLAATHELTYQVEFVWENWRRKAASGAAAGAGPQPVALRRAA